mmetsp:Transcript_15975/g.34582  ORF Transcript_15975/g.34582 Transcript_15975/m.34582 type:complete len:82 (+) Transcript_15975:385-630(+)
MPALDLPMTWSFHDLLHALDVKLRFHRGKRYPGSAEVETKCVHLPLPAVPSVRLQMEMVKNNDDGIMFPDLATATATEAVR